MRVRAGALTNEQGSWKSPLRPALDVVGGASPWTDAAELFMWRREARKRAEVDTDTRLAAIGSTGSGPSDGGDEAGGLLQGRGGTGRACSRDDWR